MADSYIKQPWEAGSPITLSKLEHMELGIYDAYDYASTLSGALSGLISDIDTREAGHFSNLNGLITRINLDISASARAWDELLDAGVEYDNASLTVTNKLNSILNVIRAEKVDKTEIRVAYQSPNATDKVNGLTVASLAQRILHIYNTITEKTGELSETLQEVSDTAQFVHDALGNVGNTQTIGARLDHLDGGNINSVSDFPTRTIKSIIDELDAAHKSTAYATEGNSYREFKVENGGLDSRLELTENEVVGARGSHNTIAERLNAIDNGGSPQLNLVTVASEIKNARESSTLNKTGNNAYASLDARLEAIEGELVTGNEMGTRIDSLETNKINISDIANDLQTSTSGKVLAAAQGVILQGRISDLDTAYKDADSTLSNNINNINTVIGADDTSGLRKRIADLETEMSDGRDTYADIDARFDAVEAKANAAAVATTVNAALETLDSRLDEIDDGSNTVISGINSKIETIANELGMLNNGAIVDTQTRVDNLEAAISHAVSGDPEHPDAGGLTERLAAAESAINTKADADDVAEALNAKANKNYVDAQLDTKVSASVVSDMSNTLNGLLNQDTIVIPKPINGSNYTQQNIPDINSILTVITTLLPNADYLILADDEKYYYWRYINEKWELISGAGGSGSGNSDSEDFATKSAFNLAAKKLNKDYYVLEADGIRHHYRYLSTENDALPIEIGILPSLLKEYLIDNYYTVDETTQERTDYLDFYGFNFGTDITTHSIDPETDAPYRLARIQLPKGGGGSAATGHRIYAKVRGDTSRLISLAEANQGITLNYGYTCYSYDEMDGYDYQSVGYTLTTGDGTIIAQSNGVVGHLTVELYNAGQSNISIPNILRYCQENLTSIFTLTLHSDTNPNITDKILQVYITVINLSLTSSFSDQQPYTITRDLPIPYEFIGMNELTPTFSILLNGVSISSMTTITNDIIYIRTSALANKIGVYNLLITAHLQVAGATLNSNTLNYLLGLIDGQHDTLMLFSGASLDALSNEQYLVLKIPYYLYVPNGEEVEVSFKGERVTYNDGVIDSRETVAELARPTEVLSTGNYEYLFRIHDRLAGTEYYLITITAGDQNLEFKITVNKAAEQINIKTDHLLFDFKPERYSNNTATEEERLWQVTTNGITYKMRIPDGTHFDWRTGGWMTVNDIPCFCVKAGSRVEFVQENNNIISPLTLFWPNMERLGGSNFKCTFKIDNVKTPNAPFLTSLDKNVSTVINYGKLILSEKLDIEADDTLLYNYLNTRYIYTKTINSSNKTVKEAIGTVVLDSNPFSAQLTEAKRASALNKARQKNGKKIKDYISNIYDIANQASVQAHREYLLKVLSGKSDSATIDYSTIKNEITTYLFDETGYNNSEVSNTNAQTVYNRLVNEGADSSTITYAYRQLEPVNFDAMLNGFVVEGKDGKDGIIAMILFTFESTIKTSNKYALVVSETPISTNSFSKTATFEVTVTDTLTSESKRYEVEMLDEDSTGTYTEIYSIRDASNIETRAYGLELNALGSNIYLPSGAVTYAHSEGDIIEFEYNVNPEIQGRVNSSIIIYEDGVPSAAKLYTSRNNIFEQTSPGCLTIGSDDCDVYIYKMRLYDRALDNADILANFYADGLTTDDMMNRYNRNKNLVKAQTITPQLIAEECPDLRVIMIEAPNLTGGKTSFIKNTKVRCIYKNGRPEDNWVALNAYHAGQGTSSDNYGAAGRNLDIMFGFDGQDTVIVPKPQKNNYTFDPTYKSMLIKGLDEDETNDILTAEEYEAAGYTVEYNGTGKVSLSPTSIPNNWFNIKVNIASSENTNNAFLQKRFDRYLPYKNQVPAHIRGLEDDIDIKNDMEFFNCVIFIKETGTPSEFTEDKDVPVADRPWHFYGIGNLGDSKKTDKTRVNVEGDPYEFCIEISDNGLKNSGFCSGVFYISNESKNHSETNADLTIINNATEIHVCTDGEYTVNGTGYTFSLGTPNATTLYLVPIVTDAFTYYRRFMYDAATWKEIGEPITFTRTSYGIKYPISTVEWTCSLNDYHKSLYDLTSGKGWDKSFEFRYDITTKDGETVARNDIEAAMNSFHQLANKKAFADMYSWIVTSSNTDFHNNLGTWFIQESPLYWYLFTERYTMIDSRAKNTFYHYGKVYISTDEYNGNVVSALAAAAADPHTYAIAHNIEDDTDNNVDKDTIATQEILFKLTAANFIYEHRDTFIKNDTQAAFNDGYRFDLWDYDNDTALGINNNGQMVFSAGLEDIDKDVSGWIYNEAESVIWRRIRENMYAELGALYVRLKGGCFNAENLILEFDTMLNQFPEELWRLDFERKYYRPFISKGETTYLNDMANGRKRYQRRQFERNMAIYINSKYQRNGSYNENDIISFRPLFTWTAGRDTRITIKPYSTMYINFMMGNDDNTGNDTVVSTRVQRGEAYIIDPTALGVHDFNNIQCIIYNASRIMELDGLGNFECKQFILGAAKKLSVLKLGSTEYLNRSMSDINNMGLSDGLPLLEELDLTNILFGTAPDTFALDNFPLLKKLNATGCNIRSFTFKDGGMLERIIFPSVLTKINFKNLYKLVDTYDEQEQLLPAVTLTGAANLISYNSTNSYSNSYEIVRNMLNNAGINGITSLKLNDIYWTINNMTELVPLILLKNKLGSEMSLKGTIVVLGEWSEVKLDDYNNKFGAGNITWDLSNATKVAEYKLRFYTSSTDIISDSDEGAYYISYVSPTNGQLEVAIGEDPVYSNDCIAPTKASTISTEYIFGTNKNAYYSWNGWRMYGSTAALNRNTLIQLNTDFVAIFTESARKYALCWFMHEGDTEAVNTNPPMVEYGKSYEEGIAPSVLDLKLKNKQTATINTSDGINCHYSIFKGWKRLPVNLDSTFLETINGEPVYAIYGDWENGTKTIDSIKNQEDVDAIKLLTLSHLSNSDSFLPIGNTLTINMGYDNNTGITIIGKNATEGIGPGGQIYDGTILNGLQYGPAVVFIDNPNLPGQHSIEPSLRPTVITPFSNMTDRGFTLAIDYQFDRDYIESLYESLGYVILSGCYENTGDTALGFALYYDCANKCAKVCFGNLAESTTYSSAVSSCVVSAISTIGRNIVVIRHPKDTDTLEIYSGVNYEGILSSITSNSFVQTLSWSKNTSNAPLCFGHFTNLTFNALASVHSGIGGTIHWAKYWNEDIGRSECTYLASWIHESLTFAVEDYSNDGVQDIISTTSQNIILSALQLSLYGSPTLLTYDRTQVGNRINWGTENITGTTNSKYKQIANQRFFIGLPIMIQAVSTETNSNASIVSVVYNTAGYVYQYASSSTTKDFAFAPSMKQVGGAYSEYNNEALRTMPWCKALNTKVYNYVGTNFDMDNPTNEQNYMNLRFFGVPINHTNNRIFIGYQGSIPVYNKINSILRGDVFIQTIQAANGEPTYVAYIYADENDKNNGVPTVKADTNTLFYCDTGGWTEAHSWWTRSTAFNYTSTDGLIYLSTSNPFYFVNSLGELSYRTVLSDGWFVYEFGI